MTDLKEKVNTLICILKEENKFIREKLSNIEELKILNINRLSSSQENINNHIIKLSNLELDKEYNSNFKITYIKKLIILYIIIYKKKIELYLMLLMDF